MATKKKPEGKAWEEFVRRWHATDHMGKVAMAKAEGVKYDTTKHWISNAGEAVGAEPTMTVTIPELLAMRPAKALDFVMFDIETSNLKADFSVLLTSCIKPYGQAPIVFRADEYPEWEKHRADDSKIVAATANELKKHAIVVGHFSSRFDIPYLRAKMVKHGLEPLPQMFGIDTWRLAKNNFQVSSRRLKNLTRYFDLGEKEQVDGAIWMDAAYNGDKEAMDKIVEHNIQDVIVLEQLLCVSFPYLKFIPKL